MIGAYDIRGTLGKGAMGAVYSGWDPRRECLVAIKVLLPGSDDSLRAEQIARFLREGEISRTLRHSNIVEVYDVGNDPESGMPYIVMEFIKGKPLHVLLKERHLTIHESVSLICQVADGLDYAAQAGVIHRDIKPANILVDPVSLTPKLVDFGVARIEGTDATHSGMVLGTPHYMSPEQCRSGVVDRRSDLFSLGAVLYELLTNVKAFPGDTIVTVMMAVLDPKKPIAPGEFRPEIPAELCAAIMKALAKEPSARFQSGREMIATLQSALTKSPTAAGIRPAELPPSETVMITAERFMSMSRGSTVRAGHSSLRRAALGLVGLLAVGGVAWVALKPTEGEKVIIPKPVQMIIPKPVEIIMPKPAETIMPKPVEIIMPKPVAIIIPKPVKIKTSTRATVAAKESLTAMTVAFGVLKNTKGQNTLLNQGDALLPYDDFAVVMRTDETMYVYIWQTDSSGKVLRIFPNAEFNRQRNPVPPAQWLWLPSVQDKKRWFHLDLNPGEEEIVIVVSVAARPELEDLLRRLTITGAGDSGNNRQILRELDKAEATLKKPIGVSLARHAEYNPPAWILRGNPGGFYHQMRLKHL
jgi:serine/threonine protein kinase